MSHLVGDTAEDKSEWKNPSEPWPGRGRRLGIG
jgi:hypothetical protein